MKSKAIASSNANSGTRAVFRIFKGEVLALFPAIAANTNPDCCLSYQHVGQHGAAHYYAVMRASVSATSAQRDALLRELIGAGYRLEVIHRSSPADYAARVAQIAR